MKRSAKIMINRKNHSSKKIIEHKKLKNSSEKNKDTICGDILKEATVCNAKPSISSSQNGGIRIVNSKNGKRLEFSKRILSALNNPKGIKLLFKNQYLILKATEKHGFPLRGQNQNTIYSAALVAEITDKFSLIFSSCTCLSFPRFKMIDDDSVLAIAIVME